MIIKSIYFNIGRITKISSHWKHSNISTSMNNIPEVVAAVVTVVGGAVVGTVVVATKMHAEYTKIIYSLLSKARLYYVYITTITLWLTLNLQKYFNPTWFNTALQMQS